MLLKGRISVTKGDFNLNAILDLQLQGITALFGKSAAGKTTLLRHIAGLDHARGAQLAFARAVWQDDRLFVPPHRRGIGYLFQQVELFSHLNVMGNLVYGFNRTPVQQRRFSPAEIIELLKIGHLASRQVGHLSGGEKQLVALGRTLLTSPRILLMDEPLSALDAATKQAIYPLLKKIAHTMQIPIIYVSHAVDEVARLADAMLLIDSGRITAQGSMGEMLTRLDLPLARQADAEVIIEGRVLAHENNWQLTEIEFSGGRFLVPLVEAPLQSTVRLRVAASDVSISLAAPSGSSIINAFVAEVVEILEEGAIAILKLRAGLTPLIARVTRKSCQNLGIKPGKVVYAQVKGAAVLA